MTANSTPSRSRAAISSAVSIHLPPLAAESLRSQVFRPRQRQPRPQRRRGIAQPRPSGDQSGRLTSGSSPVSALGMKKPCVERWRTRAVAHACFSRCFSTSGPSQGASAGGPPPLPLRYARQAAPRRGGPRIAFADRQRVWALSSGQVEVGIGRDEGSRQSSEGSAAGQDRSAAAQVADQVVINQPPARGRRQHSQGHRANSPSGTTNSRRAPPSASAGRHHRRVKGVPARSLRRAAFGVGAGRGRQVGSHRRVDHLGISQVHHPRATRLARRQHQRQVVRGSHQLSSAPAAQSNSGVRTNRTRAASGGGARATDARFTPPQPALDLDVGNQVGQLLFETLLVQAPAGGVGGVPQPVRARPAREMAGDPHRQRLVLRQLRCPGGIARDQRPALRLDNASSITGLRRSSRSSARQGASGSRRDSAAEESKTAVRSSMPPARSVRSATERSAGSWANRRSSMAAACSRWGSASGTRPSPAYSAPSPVSVSATPACSSPRTACRTARAWR